jgi:hypothetical protein
LVMTAERLAEGLVKAYPWQARCTACGEWVATVPAGALWVQAKCQNWRVNREIASDRKCPLYGKMQTLHKR